MSPSRDIKADLRQHLGARMSPGGGTRYGLVIGINHYRQPGLDLKYAVADAEAVHALMVDPECGNFAPEHVTLLPDAQATREGIRKALTDLRRKARPEDTVWIFFSGHKDYEDLPDREQAESFWLPHDGDPNDLVGTALGDRELGNITARIRAERLVVYLDCCHAAAGATRADRRKDTRPPPEVILGRFSGRGRLTLAASDRQQKAVEVARHGHGAFTYFLERGLRGEADADGDGVVTADELWAYLREKVRAAAAEAGVGQEPVKSGETTHDLALTLNSAVNGCKYAVARAVQALVGVGTDRLTTAEAEYVLALLQRRADTDAERAIEAQYETLAAGTAGVAVVRQLIRHAQDEAAWKRERGDLKRQSLRSSFYTAVVLVVLACAALLYQQARERAARARQHEALIAAEHAAAARRQLEDTQKDLRQMPSEPAPDPRIAVLQSEVERLSAMTNLQAQLDEVRGRLAQAPDSNATVRLVEELTEKHREERDALQRQIAALQVQEAVMASNLTAATTTKPVAGPPALPPGGTDRKSQGDPAHPGHQEAKTNEAPSSAAAVSDPVSPALDLAPILSARDLSGGRSAAIPAGQPSPAGAARNSQTFGNLVVTVDSLKLVPRGSQLYSYEDGSLGYARVTLTLENTSDSEPTSVGLEDRTAGNPGLAALEGYRQLTFSNSRGDDFRATEVTGIETALLDNRSLQGALTQIPPRRSVKVVATAQARWSGSAGDFRPYNLRMVLIIGNGSGDPPAGLRKEHVVLEVE